MIYFAHLESHSETAKGTIAKWADENDLRRAQLKKNPLAQHNSLLARAILRQLLAENNYAAQAEIKLNGKGKPYLENGPHISLTHSNEVAAAAISSEPVGIDIEFWRQRNFAKLAAYAFGPQEIVAVREKGIAEFYRIWTMREAIAKMHGCSVFINMDGNDADLRAISIYHDWPRNNYTLAISMTKTNKPLKDNIKECIIRL